jgi:hypothetical protein
MAKKPKTTNEPKPPPAQIIEICSARRSRKSICIAYSQGESDVVITERENPLPSFNKAFDALAPLVANICHLPADYTKKDFRVVGFKLTEGHGSRQVSIIGRRDLKDAAKEFVLVTPFRMIDKPSEEGAVGDVLTPKFVELVEEAIEEAKKYVKGERAQGLLAFDEDDESDDGTGAHEPAGGEELLFPKQEQEAAAQ